MSLFASPLKLDETIIFFNSNAYLDASGQSWVVPVHGWIFEPEYDSMWRTVAIKGLFDGMNLDENGGDRSLFEQRVRMFLVDNERWKKIHLKLQKQRFDTQISKANGHFEAHAVLKASESGTNRWLQYSVETTKSDKRSFYGNVQLVASNGVSVISDIDDTIKVSNVLDKKALLENTFVKEFEPVIGMKQVYAKWLDSGAVFHYVSSSPWQLYPALTDFMQRVGFPKGSFHLKLFRMKDQSLFNLLKSSEETKPPIIKSLLNQYPKRRFIFVGDSGEKDPEIYGKIARSFLHQVVHIYIRKVEQAENNVNRFEYAFTGVPKSKWTVFDNPAELLKLNLGNL